MNMASSLAPLLVARHILHTAGWLFMNGSIIVCVGMSMYELANAILDVNNLLAVSESDFDNSGER